MQLSSLFWILGYVLVLCGLGSVFSLGIEFLYDGKEIDAFVLTSFLCFFFGCLSFLIGELGEERRKTQNLIMYIVFGYTIFSLFASLPFVLADISLSFTDAFFEAMSGITTTGATIIPHPENLSKGLLIWRSLLQWVGGIVFLSLCSSLLPYMRYGGMETYSRNSEGRSDKVFSQTSDLLGTLMFIYVLISFFCFLFYFIAGMSMFDAINHAMTTVSTGGFSTRSDSFDYYNSVSLELVSITFMIIASLPFVLYISYIKKGNLSFFKDEQVQAFLALNLVFVAWISIFRVQSGDEGLGNILIQSSFDIVSLMTTTGYWTSDFTNLSGFAVALTFFLAYIGGCAGSTSGGTKVLRLIIVAKALKNHVFNLKAPNTVKVLKFQGKKVDERTVTSIMTFLCLFVIVNTALSVVLAAYGIEFFNALGLAVSVTSNIGAGLNEIIGNENAYLQLSGGMKWLLSFAMLAGRLEIAALLVIFTSVFWKK